MSSTYTPPSRDQLMARMQVQAPKMSLYQPGEKWLLIEFSGNHYWMPPDLGGRPTAHPVTGQEVPGDGRMLCGTHYGNIYSKTPQVDPVTGQRRRLVVGRGPMEGESADAIVVFAIENFGVRGVVWLEGNEGDEGKVAAARKIYQRWRRDSAEATVGVRRTFVNTWLALPANKGRTAAEAPPQTELQREAQEFLDEMAEERRLASAFICVHDGYDTNDQAKYIRHMKAAHNETVTPGKVELDLTKPADLEQSQKIALEITKKARPVP